MNVLIYRYLKYLSSGVNDTILCFDLKIMHKSSWPCGLTHSFSVTKCVLLAHVGSSSSGSCYSRGFLSDWTDRG